MLEDLGFFMSSLLSARNSALRNYSHLSIIEFADSMRSQKKETFLSGKKMPDCVAINVRQSNG